MSSFFQQSAYALISQYPEDFPLLKIQYVLDWQTENEIGLDNSKPIFGYQRLFGYYLTASIKDLPKRC